MFNNCNIFTTFAEKFKYMAQVRKVIHVELLGSGEHFYFGSMSAIYDHFKGEAKELLGISYSSLRNVGLSPEKPYKNKKCVIREGELIASPKRTE